MQLLRQVRFSISRRQFLSILAAISFAFSLLFSNAFLVLQARPSRNVVIFVADGLRHGSVNETTTPTLYHIRQQGVHFVNSHSLFPTFTTPNASAIATGHYLGDTGDFSNTIYAGFPVTNAGGSVTPFIENNPILADIDERFPGESFLNEETLLAAARKAGFNTAAVGKLGPTLIQDVTEGNRVNGIVPEPTTVILDDTTGRTGGVPLRSDIATAIANDAYFTNTFVNTTPPLTTKVTITPDRSNGAPACTAPGVPVECRNSNGFSGSNTIPGTAQANLKQQQYFTDVITRAILPTFKAQAKPFALVYWSRDPDGSQHNQGDSLNSLTPGINGPTSQAAVQNVDNNIKQVLDALEQLGLSDNIDVFVTADHGFSTISKSAVNAAGTLTSSYAATQTYAGVNAGFLPVGFVAIDLANFLNLPLYDPDTAIANTFDAKLGNVQYPKVDATQGQKPRSGNAVIGGTGTVTNGKVDGSVVVAANGGSDLIYLPAGNPVQENGKTLAANIVDFLTRQDYISGIFSDDSLGRLPGALPLSVINLKGSALTPVPAIVVNFTSFSADPQQPLQSEVEIADTGLQQGQGMHGSFGRSDTYNNMAAIGPDFKTGFVDSYPVSNADVAVTLAHILKLDIPSQGKLKGRVIKESLVGRSRRISTQATVLKSKPAANGQRTILNLQTVGDTRYFDAAGFRGRTVGLRP